MNLEELEKNGLCGLVFDCDGVMIDSADANRRFYALALGRWACRQCAGSGKIRISGHCQTGPFVDGSRRIAR